jgi:hypothetical protein
MARTPEQIHTDISQARERLASGVEGLVAQTHPAALKREVAIQARAKAQEVLGSVTGQLVDDAGVRWNRVGTIALSAIGIVVVWKTLRGLVRLVRR